MTRWNYGIWGAVGLWALLAMMQPAGAQENLDQGKTTAQLFASDCAICHKSPNGLAKSGGLFGLDNFLRVHYTASRESADRLAKYLQSFANTPEPGNKSSKRSARGSDKEKKPAEAKSSKDKSSKDRPAKDKSAKEKDSKPAEAKADPKAESKDEPKKDMKETPKAAPKSEAKSDAKPEAKPESKPEKSD